MLTQQDNARRPSFDCLDFGRLRRLLADLALQVGYLLPGRDEISGFDLDALPCRHASATGRHCQPFLLQLAHDAQADPAVQCRACLSGAFTLAVRLDDAGDSPVILACGLTQALPASQEARNQLRALQLELNEKTDGFDELIRRQKELNPEQTTELEKLHEDQGTLADIVRDLTKPKKDDGEE